MTAMAIPARGYLLRPLAGTWLRDLALIASGVALVAALAQVSIPVPGSPVPITGQTLGVMLVGATLGLRRSIASMSAYLVLGMVGLPVFSDGAGGLAAAFGATGGYLFGFILAVALMGYAAERGWDRTPAKTLALGLAGQAAIFAVGIPWLAVAAHMNAAQAIDAGLVPFLFGGVVKGLIAAAVLPLAWRFVGHMSRSGRD